MTASVTPEYAGAADAHAAPLVDQKYLRKNDQTKHGEEHDNQHERHVGTLLEDAGVCPAPGAGSSARAHARGGSVRDNPRQSHSCLLSKSDIGKILLTLTIRVIREYLQSSF